MRHLQVDAPKKKCSCDAFGDGPCPVHAEECRLQDERFKRAVRCPHCEDIVIIDCQERQPWKQTYTWTVADQIRHYKGLGFPKMSRRARERQYVQTVCDECVLSQEYDKYYMLRDEVVTEGRPLREVLSSVGVDWSKIDQQSALELW